MERSLYVRQNKYSWCVLCREPVLFSEVQISITIGGYRETNYWRHWGVLSREVCYKVVQISRVSMC